MNLTPLYPSRASRGLSRLRSLSKNEFSPMRVRQPTGDKADVPRLDALRQHPLWVHCVAQFSGTSPTETLSYSQFKHLRLTLAQSFFPEVAPDALLCQIWNDWTRLTNNLLARNPCMFTALAELAVAQGKLEFAAWSRQVAELLHRRFRVVDVVLYVFAIGALQLTGRDQALPASFAEVSRRILVSYS